MVQKAQTAGTAAPICSLCDISQSNLFTHSREKQRGRAEWSHLVFTTDLLLRVLMVFSVHGVEEEEMHQFRSCLELSIDRWLTFVSIQNGLNGDSQTCLILNKFILKCWYSVLVCIKLGRSTVEHTEK